MTERTVPLTDDQYTTLRNTFDLEHVVVDVLGKLAQQLAEDRAKQQRKAWDTIYRLAKTAPSDSNKVTVDWINRCIVVKVDDTECSSTHGDIVERLKTQKELAIVHCNYVLACVLRDARDIIEGNHGGS